VITYALYHIKGGVGKTAAAVNLAFLAASEGKRTLLCDLDPQSSATFYFRIKPKIKSGIKPLIKGKKQAIKTIKESDFEDLDLMPSDFSLRNMDLVLDNVKDSKNRLKQFLKSFKKEYDYIFLDCPPNITLVSENIFQAADIILVPVIPTTLSLRTFQQLVSFFKAEKLQKKKLVPFFSMVEQRKKMHKESIESLRNKFHTFLRTEIPYSSVVEKMGLYRAPLGTFKANSIPAQRYAELWGEIKTLTDSQ
jgi:cellulose biosynthesis protein BcsQ